jgi:hypothetical protein
MEDLDSGRVKPISHGKVFRRLASAIEWTQAARNAE